MAGSILYHIDEESELERLVRAKYRQQLDVGELVCDFVHADDEALARVASRTEPYGLVVVDIAASGSGGLRLLDALATSASETAVVVLSAADDLVRTRAALRRGAFDFLLEPIDLDELDRTQREALGQFEARRQLDQLDHGKPELAALGLLVIGVAHDLKNPLGFVSGFNDLALELVGELGETIGARATPPLADELRVEVDAITQALEKVRAHTDAVLQMVGTLLPSSARGRPLDLNAALARYVGLYESSLRATAAVPGLVIHAHYEDGIGSLALESSDLLRIVVNLLDNAVYAVRERAHGEPEIWVETRALAGGVELSVSDNGQGVSAELRDRIFQPFFTTKAHGEGTGLGLHLVQQLATKAGGGVELEDRHPTGARFRVRFAR